MPSPIPKGRFNSEQEIIAAIDSKIAEIQRLRIAATSLFNQARAAHLLFEKCQGGRPKLLAKRDKLNDRGDRKMKRADKIESGYLRQLKCKLAVFRTPMLPVLDNGDGSISK